MHSSQSNKGSALAISLVILTAITLISVSSLQRSGLQGRMVGNIQHKEEAFHTANNELEGLFEFYIKGTDKDDPSAEAAAAFDELFIAANSNSQFINNKEVYEPVDTSYDPEDGNIEGKYSHVKLVKTRSLQFKKATLPPGYSTASFKNHNYDLNVSVQETSTIPGAVGKTVSNQTMGVSFIAPAG